MKYSYYYKIFIALAVIFTLSSCGSGGNVSNSSNNSDTSPIILSSAPILSIEGSFDTSGQTRGALKDGDYVYVADGSAGLIVLQEFPGYTLSKIGSLALINNGRAFSLAKHGNYLYMASRDEGIYVIDVTNPSSPSRSSIVPMPDVASFLSIHQNMLYVSAGSYFMILDISDPVNPQITGQIMGSAPNQNLIIENNKAYIAAYNRGLLIIDVSDPYSPSVISETRIHSNYSVRGIAKRGDYIYIGGGGSGLLVYNVANLVNPSFVTQVFLPDEDGQSPYDIITWENFLFIADGASGIQVVDITTPAIPILVDSIDTLGSSRSIVVHNLTAIIADYDEGIQLLNVFKTTDTDGDGVLDGDDAFPDDPSEWSDTDNDGTGNNTDSDDDNDGFLDVNDDFPTNPLEWTDTDGDGTGDNSDIFIQDSSEWADSDVDGIGDNTDTDNLPVLSIISSSDTVGQVRGTLKDGDIIYVSDGSEGLLIFQIALDGSLTEIGSYPLTAGGRVRYFAKINNYLYMACRSEGLLVLDVSDNSNPQLVDTYDTPDMATFITIVDSTLYLSDRNSLQIFDISVPSSLEWLGALAAPSEFEHIVVDDGIAYIAGYYHGLFVVDVSDPTAPTQIDRTPAGFALWAVEKHGNYIFAGGETSGLIVFDIQNPYRPDPVIVTSLPLPDGAMASPNDRPPFHMKIRGSYLFVADGYSGIQIVDISNPLSPFIAAELDTPGYALDFYFDGYTMTIGDYRSGFRMVNLGTDLDHDNDGIPNYIDDYPLIPY